MSSGVSDPGRVAALRAMAHPLRLRMLAMLTGTAMSAADVARELDLTHANASYHLRQMRDAGLLVVAEEESVRGGRAKRYRYDAVGNIKGMQHTAAQGEWHRRYDYALDSNRLLETLDQQVAKIVCGHPDSLVHDSSFSFTTRWRMSSFCSSVRW